MIIAAGDSFVYGSELQSPANTFTALLGADECIAWPGYGNDAIARTTMTRCEQGGVTGVIVCWSFPGRYEFRFAYSTKQKKSPWYSINTWTIKSDIDSIKEEFVTDNHGIFVELKKEIAVARQSGVADFADVFYKHVGSTEYWETYTSLKEIVYLQNYLTVKGIPFMFTCVDHRIFNNYVATHPDDIISSLIGQIDHSKWFWFPKCQDASQPLWGWQTQSTIGFYQWALENKYPIGTTHPLELAHLDASKLLQEKFNDLVKKHI